MTISSRLDYNRCVRSKEWIEKQRLSQKGKTRNKGKDNPFYGRKHTSEELEKMRLAHKGKKRPPRSKEWGQHISEGKRGKTQGSDNHFFGKHHSEETKMVISEAQIADPKFRRFGEENHNWQGGITSENHQARNTQDLKSWRRAVYQRDNFTCQRCGVKGSRKHRLNAHHIKAFATHIELRFEVNNGITLCKNCHKYETTRLELVASLEGDIQRGQQDRIKFRKHRLEILEQLNTVVLIKERGYLSYWTVNSTHILPRIIYTKAEARLNNQIEMIMSEAMQKGSL